MVSRITPKGFRYAVCSLKAKRAEIDGAIAELELQLKHLRNDMAKVDDILRILSPTFDPTQIAPRKALKHLNLFKQGELGALIVGVLRADNRPLTNLEISQVIIERSGYAKELWVPVRRRCCANLHYLENQGRVTKVSSHRTAKWMIAV